MEGSALDESPTPCEKLSSSPVSEKLNSSDEKYVRDGEEPGSSKDFLAQTALSNEENEEKALGKSDSVGASSSFGSTSRDFYRDQSLALIPAYMRGPYAPVDRYNSTSASSNVSSTITQHYYPEGGWGYVILLLAFLSNAFLGGFHFSSSILMYQALQKYDLEVYNYQTELLSGLSISLSYALSPLWYNICVKKSTRLAAVFAGLLSSMGCLFTSFASQFHQMYFSYGVLMSLGIGLSRDASLLMLAQYFKRKRLLVETLLASSTGFGLCVMSTLLHFSLSWLGWRIGLQVVTVVLFSTFIMSTCYRSASLYHPQRRAIMHLKRQKRKTNQKEEEDRFWRFKFGPVCHKTYLRVILVAVFLNSSVFAALLHLVRLRSEIEEGPKSLEQVFLYIYTGGGWMLGTFIFGFIAVQESNDCRISKFCLWQIANALIAVFLVLFIKIGEHGSLSLFCWGYGFSLGGFNYSQKIFLQELIRARDFAQSWSIYQSAQGFGLFASFAMIGVARYLGSVEYGYYACCGSVLLSTCILILMRMFCLHEAYFMPNFVSSSIKTCTTLDSSFHSIDHKRKRHMRFGSDAKTDSTKSTSTSATTVYKSDYSSTRSYSNAFGASKSFKIKNSYPVTTSARSSQDISDYPYFLSGENSHA